MNEWIPIGVLFGSVFLIVFAVLQWVAWRRERELRRLQEIEGGLLDSTPDLLLGEAAPVLAQAFPLQGEKAAEVNQELIHAGFYRANALVDYAAVRFVLVVVPLILAGSLALVVDQRYITQVAFIGIVLSALGYSLPRVYINYRARQRRNEISRALPVAVDLLALGLMSGQNILTALQRVTEEIRHSFPVLSEELSLVRQQAELNTLPHALAQFADRVQMTEVRTLVIILSQSQRQGTDIASALMEFVNNFRMQMRQEADRRANQASFWLVFPSIFFLWVPAFAILVAPVIFELANKRELARDQSQKMQADIDRLNSRGRMAPSTTEEPNQ